MTEPRWFKLWANDHTLVKNVAVPPTTLLVPVCSCVGVIPNTPNSYKAADGDFWKARPDTVAPENLDTLRTMAQDYPGWELRVLGEFGEKYLRGENDPYEYFGHSSHCYYRYMDMKSGERRLDAMGGVLWWWNIPGLVRVSMHLVDVKLAEQSIDVKRTLPACPSCDLDIYEDIDGRRVFDKAMMYVINHWLFGEPL